MRVFKIKWGVINIYFLKVDKKITPKILFIKTLTINELLF